MSNRSQAALLLSLALLGACASPTTETGAAVAGSEGVRVVDAAANGGDLCVLESGRYLWVFHNDSPELAEFRQGGELARHVTRPAAGPGRRTLKAPDPETLDLYLAARPGFVVRMEDGRLWVFRDGCEELAQVRAGGELAKHVTRPAAGPGGLTVKAPDSDTIDAYLAALR